MLNKPEMDYYHAKLSLVTLLLILVIVTTPTPVDSFGYDSATSCDPRMSRRGRAQLIETIPCDLSVQAYCNLPGASYPWHAVRRFVHENQGLMRRMYGDVRHISVLKAEIDSNEIEIDDIENAAERYSRAGGQKKMKYLHNNHQEYPREKNNDVLSEPYFRPTQKLSTTTPKTSTTTRPTTTTATTTAFTRTETIPSTMDIETSTESSNLKRNDDNNTLNNDLPKENVDLLKLAELLNESLETNNVLANITATMSDNIKIVQAPNLNSSQENTETRNSPDDTATISSTLKIFQTEKVVETTLKTEIESTIASIITDDNQDDIEDTVVEDNSDVDVGEIDNVASASEISEQNLKNENIKSPPKKMESQLFQDAAQKDAPVVNMRGVNACPVKEEVVAPFWANNTRGEVLALLNLYPFEQYVHWEKCTHEHKQMYCREGCRCEQQYRLHRLLAYDPHNECRGIFSDWFRFPSCCICKCYDIPLDFRVTSRSPRSLNTNENNMKEKIEYIEDELQNAIYNHATDDWYRPKDFD